MNKTEKATLTSALAAMSEGDTGRARALLAPLLLDRIPKGDDEKVRTVLLSNTKQYEHNGTTTTGLIWCEAEYRGSYWVVNNHTGELHKVNAGFSDDVSYRPTGHDHIDACACRQCCRARVAAAA